MRDLALGMVLLTLCLAALRRPWIGVMAWTWLSLMSPHAYTWRLNSLPVAAAVAICTLIGLLFTKDRDFYLTPEICALIAFMSWMCVTLPFSFRASPMASSDSATASSMKPQVLTTTRSALS